MKQCPNPNCMLYTRLEELPDAYVKCPGCGGPLVDADLQSRVLSSGHISKGSRAHSVLLDPAVAREETMPRPQQLVMDEIDGMGQPPSAGYPYEGNYPFEELEGAQAYGYAEAPAPVVERMERRTTSTLAKLGLLVAGLLLLGVCVAVAMIATGRASRLAPATSGPRATETALYSMRPAVNTPLNIISTYPAGPGSSSAGRPQSVPQLPAATAPAPQPQASGGVLEAHMTPRLEGGEPAGQVSTYRPSEPFHLAVRANFGAGGVTSVHTRWYGPGGAQIYELRKEYSQSGAYYAGFTLRKDTPWAPGDYRVDIHTNDSPIPAYTVQFSVAP